MTRLPGAIGGGTLPKPSKKKALKKALKKRRAEAKKK